ncbi:hypothetical protein N665_0030s0111 [Sinapis alba]|nr:hypothetical protein N665_0030s0111 [Sinapis alba]
MFMSSQGIERILMIYLLVSLGLAYHFEEEIYDTLKESFTKIEEMMEALSFTSSHLKSLASGETCPPHLSMHIKNALYLSQQWNMEMLVAVKYIPFYQQEDDHDEMLLRFAKISFKLLQLQYIQELKILTEQRIVVDHFLIQAVFSESQVSRARIMLTQYYTILAITDDTFDRYASLPEAEILANSFERWSPHHAMDKQPEFLKAVLNFILDTYEDFEKEVRLEGKPYSVEANIEEFKAFVKANFEHAKWAHAAHLPSFEKYMEVAEVEITICAVFAACFMSLGKMATKEAYEWFKSRPRLVKSLCVRGRLMNDITGLKDDMSRGQITNAVNYYMKQYGVTKQNALRELHKMVADTDNIINEELLTTTGVSRLVLKTAMGLAQSITICYYGYEGYTHPEGKIEEYMTSFCLSIRFLFNNFGICFWVWPIFAMCSASTF